MKYTHLLFTLASTSLRISAEMELLFQELKRRNYRLVIVLPANLMTYRSSFLPSYFDDTLVVGNTPDNQNSTQVIRHYLEKNQLKRGELLYIGTNICDMRCTLDVKVDFGLALWESPSHRHIYASYYFNTPRDVIYTLNKQANAPITIPWLKWAMELQFMAQAGITYSKDMFDQERFERLREIAAEIMTLKTGLSPECVKSVFCNETGFQTPKLDTRAAIFRDHKILLVKEKSNTWSLPGGWVDVNQSIKTNTVKEVKEEAGLDIVPIRLIALQDRNMHNLPIYAYGVCKAFVLCEEIGGHFEPNNETSESNYFGRDELPPLALEKNNEEQIQLCFDAYQSDHWDAVFD